MTLRFYFTTFSNKHVNQLSMKTCITRQQICLAKVSTNYLYFESLCKPHVLADDQSELTFNRIINSLADTLADEEFDEFDGEEEE